MNNFILKWEEAANTSLGFFWMALWAFILGYALSSIIQVFLTEKRMQESMGPENFKSVFLGTFFGFISSSCSFSALATTKSLFQKGASFVSSIAFLLASTNLVVELGIVIFIFLGWQFVVGEYVGAILLILFSWLLIKIIKPRKIVEDARKRLDTKGADNKDQKKMSDKLTSTENWIKAGKQYFMEWKMVWKDVTMGFTIAGIVASFVPDQFFETLFINSSKENHTFSFLTLLEHVLVGPLAAFMTFIGSMGNIPLAALLFDKGVSFAGVMAFIFSDLVVFPVLRINARYYGWKMSLFILFLLFSSLIGTSLLLHYSLDFLKIIPEGSKSNIVEQDFFKINYTFYLNIAFLIISGIFIYLGYFKGKNVKYHKEMAPKSKTLEKFLKYLAIFCFAWLIAGIFVPAIVRWIA